MTFIFNFKNGWHIKINTTTTTMAGVNIQLLVRDRCNQRKIHKISRQLLLDTLLSIASVPPVLPSCHCEMPPTTHVNTILSRSIFFGERVFAGISKYAVRI